MMLLGQEWGVLANVRAVRIEKREARTEVWLSQTRGEQRVPVRTHFRAIYTNRHNRGELAFIAATLSECVDTARIRGIKITGLGKGKGKRRG